MLTQLLITREIIKNFFRLFKQLIKLGEEVDSLLKHNIVQCQQNEEGVYSKYIQSLRNF